MCFVCRVECVCVCVCVCELVCVRVVSCVSSLGLARTLMDDCALAEPTLRCGRV